MRLQATTKSEPPRSTHESGEVEFKNSCRHLVNLENTGE